MMELPLNEGDVDRTLDPFQDPNQATDQFAATLARWFGVPSAQLRNVFPNLMHFG